MSTALDILSRIAPAGLLILLFAVACMSIKRSRDQERRRNRK